MRQRCDGQIRKIVKIHSDHGEGRVTYAIKRLASQEERK